MMSLMAMNNKPVVSRYSPCQPQHPGHGGDPALGGGLWDLLVNQGDNHSLLMKASPPNARLPGHQHSGGDNSCKQLQP